MTSRGWDSRGGGSPRVTTHASFSPAPGRRLWVKEMPTWPPFAHIIQVCTEARGRGGQEGCWSGEDPPQIPAWQPAHLMGRRGAGGNRWGGSKVQEAVFHPTPCEGGLLQVLQKAGVKAVPPPRIPPSQESLECGVPLRPPERPVHGRAALAQTEGKLAGGSSDGAEGHRSGPRPGELLHPPQTGRGQALAWGALLHSPSFLQEDPKSFGGLAGVRTLLRLFLRASSLG